MVALDIAHARTGGGAGGRTVDLLDQIDSEPPRVSPSQNMVGPTVEEWDTNSMLIVDHLDGRLPSHEGARTAALAFYNNTTGHSHGQTDGILYAYDDADAEKTVLGYIDWASYGGNTQIQYINVLPEHRRKGIGTALVRELERTAGEPVTWSGTTSEGEALRRSLDAEMGQGLQELTKEQRTAPHSQHEMWSESYSDDSGIHYGRVAAGLLGQALAGLRPQLAQAAQQVIDDWQQNEEGIDCVLGTGGPCDQMATAMAGVITDTLPDVDIREGGQEGDDHAWLVVSSADEAYEVDIPPGVYETGGGYSWTKRPDAQVMPGDVIIYPIPRHWLEAAMQEYSLAGPQVGGLAVGGSVANTSSISASLVDYTVLRGVREVPMSEFSSDPRKLFYAADDIARTEHLAEEIRQSQRIDPLIVVVDADGPYILEGAHRLGALHLLGAQSLPALVVLDNESLGRAVEAAASVDEVQSPSLARNWLEAQAASSDLVFYRGTEPGQTIRIQTGNDWWDSQFFVADNLRAAQNYGSAVEEIHIAPSAKILYEGTQEFVRIAGRWRRGESLLDFASRAAKTAALTGYDAVHFRNQSDVGTVIMNLNVVVERTLLNRKAQVQSVAPVADDNEWLPPEDADYHSDTQHLRDTEFYHGTPNTFETFAPHPGYNTTTLVEAYPESVTRAGYFFTDNPEFAATFTGEIGHVIPVRLRLGSNLNIDHGMPEMLVPYLEAQGITDIWRFTPGSGGGRKAWQMFDDDYGQRVVRALKAAGYHSVSFHEDDASTGVSGLTYMVFDPAQIVKHAQVERDIVVCVPEARRQAIEAEERDVAAREARGEQGLTYYWQMGRLPKEQPKRLFFAWDGAVRAYHDVVGMDRDAGRIYMATAIHEVEPILMPDFRGFRYYYDDDASTRVAAGGLPPGFDGFDESEDAPSTADPELKLGDRFQVDGRGPVWIVERARGSAGAVRREDQKRKWFGFSHGRDEHRILIYPVTQGGGERAGPDIADGRPVLVEQEREAEFGVNLHELDEGRPEASLSQHEQWSESYNGSLEREAHRTAAQESVNEWLQNQAQLFEMACASNARESAIEDMAQTRETVARDLGDEVAAGPPADVRDLYVALMLPSYLDDALSWYEPSSAPEGTAEGMDIEQIRKALYDLTIGPARAARNSLLPAPPTKKKRRRAGVLEDLQDAAQWVSDSYELEPAVTAADLRLIDRGSVDPSQLPWMDMSYAGEHAEDRAQAEHIREQFESGQVSPVIIIEGDNFEVLADGYGRASYATVHGLKVPFERYRVERSLRRAARPPWVAIDLDGTLLSYEPGMAQRDEFGEPLPGAREALAELVSLGWRVSIYTARLSELSDEEAGEAADKIATLLRGDGFEFTDVWVGRKPRADFFVDDKALHFDGDWDAMLSELLIDETDSDHETDINVDDDHGRDGVMLIDTQDGDPNDFEPRHDLSIRPERIREQRPY